MRPSPGVSISSTTTYLSPPEKAARYNYDTASLSKAPSLSELVGEIKGEWLQDSIGYLTVPWVSTTDSLICERVADSLQELIARLDRKGITRWIIDLRKNTVELLGFQRGLHRPAAG